MSEKEKLITAYHEGGHALVAAALPGTDPVHKVTILPRGRALGLHDGAARRGQVLPDPLGDARQARLHARRPAAEEMIFHDPTTGAGNDIEKATSLARAMVTQYGMTERLGAIKLGDSNSEPFLGRDMGHQRNYSEDVAAIVDEETKKLARRPRTRRPSTSSRRTATSSTPWCSSCSTRRRSTRPRSPRSSSRCALPPAAPGLDRLARPQPVGDPAGRDPPGDPRPRAAATARPRTHEEGGVVLTPPGSGGDVARRPAAAPAPTPPTPPTSG